MKLRRFRQIKNLIESIRPQLNITSNIRLLTSKLHFFLFLRETRLIIILLFLLWKKNQFCTRITRFSVIILGPNLCIIYVFISMIKQYFIFILTSVSKKKMTVTNSTTFAKIQAYDIIIIWDHSTPNISYSYFYIFFIKSSFIQNNYAHVQRYIIIISSRLICLPNRIRICRIIIIIIYSNIHSRFAVGVLKSTFRWTDKGLNETKITPYTLCTASCRSLFAVVYNI